MYWTEPVTADDSHAALRKKLWDAANMPWAGADLKPSEYSPTSIVRLIVEILKPYHSRIFDPACGSGGMFIQSARFVEAHKSSRTLTPALSQGERGKEKVYSGDATAEISVHGQERVTDTSRLARLNFAVHGLSGDIKQSNTYYEDLQDSVGRFTEIPAQP